MKFGKYEKGIIIGGVIVAIILLILFTTDGIKNIGNKNNNLKLAEQIETEIESRANAPVLSAGMIPVKMIGDNVVITTKDDSSWYNYDEDVEKPAYIMLNDGVYQSELVENMLGKKLAQENIGQVVTPEEQGSIYIWMPRWAKKGTEIKYIPAETQPGDGWVVYYESNVFAYYQEGENVPDLSLEGIWIEKDPLTDSNAVSIKVNNMLGENNSYGFIANTIGTGDNYISDTFAEWCRRKNTNIDVSNFSNYNRTALKVIDSDKYEPLKAKIAYNNATTKIEISVTYTKNGIKKIIDNEGNEFETINKNGIITATITPTNSNTHYFTIIDNKDNKKGLNVSTVLPIYVTLYSDGTLGFNSTNEKISGKTVTANYGDISGKRYLSWTEVPWYSRRTSVKSVNIASKISPTSTNFWFHECTNLTRIDNIENIDTVATTTMHCMFYKCSSLKSIDLSSFNTSNVNTMSGMFQECTGLTSVNLSSFDTSRVNRMFQMFYGCSSLTNLNLRSFDTRKATDMKMMFYNCTNLKTIYVSSNWITSQADVTSMFTRCRYKLCNSKVVKKKHFILDV